MLKLIIFDFDGVLADSFESFFMLIKNAMKSAGISLTQNQYRNFFIGNIHQGFRNFIKDEDKYEIFSKFRKENYNKYYKKVRLFPDVPEILKNLSKDYILAIASSGSRENILKLLKTNGTGKPFGTVLATTENTKENMIKEILRKDKITPRQAVMITDTAGDIKIAKKLKLKTIAVTWGFHSKKLLESSKPDHIVSNLKILYNKLKAF